MNTIQQYITNEVPALENNPRDWAVAMSVVLWPEEILEAYLKDLIVPGGDLAVQKLCEMVSDAGNSLEDVLAIIEAVYYANIDNYKPADFYRSLIKPLRWIREQGVEDALYLIREISLDQTLPYGELEAPAHVDQYTGEVDEYEELIPIRDNGGFTITPNLQHLMDRLNWSKEDAMAYVKAQEGFNAADGEDEEWFEDRTTEIDKPMWMLISEDTRSENYGELRESSGIDAVFEEVQKQVEAFFDTKCKTDFKETIKLKVGESDVYRNFIANLQSMADHNSSPVDLCLIVAPLQGHQLVPGKAMGDVRLYDGTSLRDYFAENIDEILENRASSFTAVEADMRFVETFCNQFMQDYRAKAEEEYAEELKRVNGKISKADVFKHPDFAAAQLTALIELRDPVTRKEIVEVDEDGNEKTIKQKTNLAIMAGWEAYREALSPAGAAAYRSTKGDMKAKMKAFWRIFYQENPQKDKIVKLTQKGVTLDSGREVSYYIATLKLKSNELDLTDEDKSRLKEILIKRRWGSQLARSL